MWGGTAKDMGDDARILKNKEIVKITSLKNIKAVYAGKDYSLALSNDGILYGWGNNTNQILSKSDKKIISAPVALNLPGSLQAIGTGNNFLVAVTKQ
jgi:alpha-tubulin suppressor-like RCC1 family protein